MALTINWTAPSPCSKSSGTLTLYAVDTTSTVTVNDLSLTTTANVGTSSNIPGISIGTHSITLVTSCSNFPSFNINGSIFASPTNNHTYTVVTTASQPNISITVTCV